ncbi:hypothetical protein PAPPERLAPAPP_04520 [Brevundimonas phage vB_BpoS-Papperlapapp]|nr:hypothetical protein PAPPERLAPAPP_04520 [Brevundimonas phage vB_BpoS-Papperlapapp]
MTKYIRQPNLVEAFQYNRQPKAEWPQWLQDYQIATPMGFQGVGAGAGVLLVPAKNGPTINVTVGEWVVYENDVLLVFRNDLFEAAFQEEGYDEWLAEKVAKSQAQLDAGETITGEDANARAAAQLAAMSDKEPAAEAPVVGADPVTPEPAADVKGGKKKPAGDKPTEDAPAAE